MARKLTPAFSPRYRFELAYNPNFDNQEVEQFGFIHLAESFVKGIIPGGIEMSEESFNGVVNPGTLMSRCDDVFCGLRKAQYVRSQLEKLNAEERERAEKMLASAAEKVGVTAEQQS